MLMFLQCVGEAVIHRGLRGLLRAVPFAQQLLDIGADTLERYRQRRRESELKSDLEEAVQAGVDEVREEAQRVVEAVAKEQPPEVKLQLESYLTQIPSVAMQSLRRPMDPSGTTVPMTIRLDDPQQLASLLPQNAPKFRAGESVPGSQQWRLERLLGAGGFGEVWLGVHTFLGEHRAFKFCLDEDARERLLRHEGETVKQVMQASQQVDPSSHGIVPLLDAWLEGETPWLAYEYVEGGDLISLAREWNDFSPADRAQRALDVLSQIAGVIGHLHQLPEAIIHRDLKPANILYRWQDDQAVLRVTDFGISQVAASCSIHHSTVSTPSMNFAATLRGAFTPIYASPQQKRGKRPDVRDDVHALGVLAYQLIVGDFTAERPAGKWRKRLAAAELSPEILDLLEACWDDDPEERPTDALDLLNQLSEVSSGESISTASPVHEDFEAILAHARAGGDLDDFLKERIDQAPLWQEEAEEGDTEAMSLWGVCLAEGIGAEQDFEGAMAWFRSAADEECPLATWNIGMLYDAGDGVEPDEEEAMRWYLKSAEQGNSEAMRYVGINYRDGEGVEQNSEEAMRWFQKSAELGNAPAMVDVGLMYDQGPKEQQNPQEALKWFHTAVELNYPYAMYNIGVFYRNGTGVTRDFVEAAKWFQQAADLGNPPAMNSLGLAYEHGEGVPRDLQTAHEWYLKAAEAGDIDAMNNLGLLYDRGGEGVAQDFEKAFQWFEAAAENGNLDAMGNVAIMLRDGEGVAQDHEEANRWCQRASEAGSTASMYDLGFQYEQGNGVAPSNREAAKWYRRAAEAGNVDAMVNLGYLLENGNGVDQDYGEAFQWYQRAAEAGDSVGMRNLGVMYENGWGTRRNLNLAEEWYEKAHQAGEESALDDLNRVRKKS